jgi:hypothetical protein
MIYLTILFIVILLAQHYLHQRTINTILLQASLERKTLADRIQHPEIRQVEPGERVEYDEPKDTAELAYVGQIVPDGIQVGKTA